MGTPSPAMRKLIADRAEDRRIEEERKKKLQNARRSASNLPFGAPYGNSSSYTPATDICSTPFVPSADCYSPPAADPSPSSDYSGGGGSFDGGGASGDY